MEYKILYGTAIYELEEQVLNKIEKGWAPQGGVSITSHIEYGVVQFKYTQAMIKQ